MIDALPVHIFLDLSMVERLLPMLRSLAPLIKPPPKSSPLISPTTLREKPLAPIRRDSQYIIDDLDAQASSFSTLRSSQPKELLVVRCRLVRLDIRCPAPLNRRGTWGNGAHLRSGIVTLDLHGLGSNIAASVPGGKGAHHGKEVNVGPVVNVEWQKMVLFFCRVPGKLNLRRLRGMHDQD